MNKKDITVVRDMNPVRPEMIDQEQRVGDATWPARWG